MSSDARTRKFQAETRKLLDLMIHSVYAQREVFLRELISNASDAIDKARYLALTDPSVDQSTPWGIRLTPDRAAGTLTIADNGIGMTYDEVVANIGTIAASGTEAFARSLAGDGTAGEGEAADGDDAPAPAEAFVDGHGDRPDLIGRFGVGFYSAFMVADKVELETTRHGADHGVRWSSTGGDAYRIAKLPPGPRGTRITLHLKPVARGLGADDDGGDPPKDFTDPAVLRAIVKRHSDFVAFPIRLDDGTADGLASEPLNSMQPLWSRPKGEITPTEVEDFYRHLTRDWEPPLAHLHVKAEGQHDYQALLYLPSRAPFDLYHRDGRWGLQLYAKRVFIMDACRELMPEHLRWVRGVVDSPDLPLNISRETVQEDRLIGAIRRHLTRRVYDELATLLADDRARYERFWSDFGPVLKEGFHHAPTDAERLRGLVLFRSTAGDGFTTLDEYAARMPAGQAAIYTLSGDDDKLLRHAPQLEGFAARGIEVLLLTDPIDEIVVGQLNAHADHPFRSAAEADIDLTAVQPRADAGAGDAAGAAASDATDGAAAGGAPGATSSAATDIGPLCDRLAALLGDAVAAVRPSDRLTTSAACLVVPAGSPSDHLVRLMKAFGQEVEPAKRVLELNAGHAVVRALAARHAATPDDAELGAYAELLFDSALVAEGHPPRDPVQFAQRVAAMMATAAG